MRDMLQAMKNDWGKPGRTGKCLLTDPVMLCEGVEEGTSTRNAPMEGISGLLCAPDKPHKHFGLRRGQIYSDLQDPAVSQRWFTNEHGTAGYISPITETPNI